MVLRVNNFWSRRRLVDSCIADLLHMIRYGDRSNGALAKFKPTVTEVNAVLQIRETAVFRGPNVWARMPVIHYVIDIGELEERPSNKIPGFYEQLVEYIPSLYDLSLIHISEPTRRTPIS